MNVHLQNLSYAYEKKTVLHDISLRIPEGRLTLVCGVTGSGKSTLLRLISGLDKPSSGSIVSSGNAENSASSMVFQQPETQLFAGSVYKDVEYGLEQRQVSKLRRPELIISALEQVGLPHEAFSRRSPFLLSGGEKRRLCIAGAIAAPPGLLVLDEPTAGLDPPAVRGLLETVQELRRSGLTIVLGTHDLDCFFPIADEVIILRQGQVHYQGPVAPLIADADKLQDAGLEVPSYARIGRWLNQRGILPAMPDSTKNLLDQLERQSIPQPDDSRKAEELAQSQSDPGITKDTANVGIAEVSPEQPELSGRKARWQLFDPRVKWLGMVLWSLVILGMNTPLPLLTATVLIAVLIFYAGISWKRTAGFFKPFLIMFLFLWIISAVSFQSGDWQLGPLGISYQGAVQGGLTILRFALLIALGFLFTETTAGAPLREGLEWAIAPLKRLGIRTRNWSLAVSITLQFVPWILQKVSQLQLALRSRGRQHKQLRHWTPRQIYMLIVPLLIIVIGMGDELATAIESRGYDPEKERTPWFVLIWRRSDTLVLVFILLTAALLRAIS